MRNSYGWLLPQKDRGGGKILAALLVAIQDSASFAAHPGKSLILGKEGLVALCCFRTLARTLTAATD